MSEEKKSILPQVGEVRFTEERGWETYLNKNGVEWCPVPMVDVPVDDLLMKWEDLTVELELKEKELAVKKERYANWEFDIVYLSDIDYKALYGSTAEKVRKQHAKRELSELNGEIVTLELGISWIKSYIPLLKEVIRSKR
jgi:hypothetical protein